MNQAINLPALRWAYEQEGLSVTAKAVLITFAMHANDRGYSWPSVERIASTWGMDRDTVRRQIDDLLVRRKICRTKKRCGFTGQVKVYRLSKIAYESGGKSTCFENDGSGDKAADKSRESGGKSRHEQRITNKEQVIVQRVHNVGYQGTAGKNGRYSCSLERDLLASLAPMLGEHEMKKNGAMWRLRIRCGKDHRKALRNALEDFNVRTPDQQAKIHNRGAWLTDRYERCLKEIEAAPASSDRAAS